MSMNQLSISYDPKGYTSPASYAPSSFQRYSHLGSSYPFNNNHLAVTPTFEQSHQVTAPIPRKDLKRLANSLDIVDSIAKMADPLSLLASLLAVSEAGMKISKSLYSFANALRSSVEDIERLAFELDTFSCVLDDLHTWLRDNQQVISQSALDTANKILRRCKRTFGDIKKMVGGADENNDPPRFWSRIRFVFQHQRIEPLRASLESCKSTLALQLSLFKLAELKQTHNLEESPKVQLLEEQKLRTRVEHHVVATQHSLVRWQRAEFNSQQLPYYAPIPSSHDSKWLLGLVPSLRLPLIPQTHYPMLPSPLEDKKEQAKEKRRMNQTVKTLLSTWTNLSERDDRHVKSEKRQERERNVSSLENPIRFEGLAIQEESTKGNPGAFQPNSRKRQERNWKPTSGSQPEADNSIPHPSDSPKLESLQGQERTPEPQLKFAARPTGDDKFRTIVNEEDPSGMDRREEERSVNQDDSHADHSSVLSNSSSIVTIDLTRGKEQVTQASPISHPAKVGDGISVSDQHLHGRDSIDVELESESPGRSSSKPRKRRIGFEEPLKEEENLNVNRSRANSNDSVDSFASDSAHMRMSQSQGERETNYQSRPGPSTPYYSHAHAIMPYGSGGYYQTQNHISSAPSFPPASSNHGHGRFVPNDPYAYGYNQSTYGANGTIPYSNGTVPNTSTTGTYGRNSYRFPSSFPSPSPTASTTSLRDSDDGTSAPHRSFKRKSRVDSNQEDVFRRFEGLLTKYRQDDLHRIEKRMQDSFDAFVDAQNAANSAQRMHQQEVQAAIRTAAEESKTQSILRLMSADGKAFQFPFASCRTWKEMKSLIQKAHRENYPELDLDDHASFFLTEGNGFFILPELWEDTVKPGSTITLRLRLSDESHSDDSYDEASEQMNSPQDDPSDAAPLEYIVEEPSSLKPGKEPDTSREDQSSRRHRRSARVNTPPPVPTPPSAVPRSKKPLSSEESSSADDHEGVYRNAPPGHNVAVNQTDTTAQQSSVLDWGELYNDLNAHLQQVMAAEASFAQSRAKQKIGSMLSQGEFSEAQHDLPEFDTDTMDEEQPPTPQRQNDLNSRHNLRLKQRRRSQLWGGSGRNAMSGQQTDPIHITPNSQSNDLTYSPQSPLPRHAFDGIFPAAQSSLIDQSSPRFQMTSAPQKTTIEDKLDYLTALLTKREQENQARDLAAKQAADEEKLKELEDKLLRPSAKHKDQVTHAITSLGSSTLDGNSMEKAAEDVGNRPRLAPLGGSSTSGNSVGRHSFRRKLFGRSSSASVVTP